MTVGYLCGQLPLLALRALITDLAVAGTAVKCALLKSTASAVIDQDTNTSYNDVKAYEVSDSGTGYTAGGVECGNKSLTYASRETTFKCVNPYWASLTLADVQYLFFYDSTPASDANKKWLCSFDLETAISLTASPLTFNVATAGLFKFTVAASS
jgi:hypothetical protein